MPAAKQITLTRHAEQKQEERRLKRVWVETTVRSPEWTEPEPTDPEATRFVL